MGSFRQNAKALTAISHHDLQRGDDQGHVDGIHGHATLLCLHGYKFSLKLRHVQKASRRMGSEAPQMLPQGLHGRVIMYLCYDSHALHGDPYFDYPRNCCRTLSARFRLLCSNCTKTKCGSDKTKASYYASCSKQ